MKIHLMLICCLSLSMGCISIKPYKEYAQVYPPMYKQFLEIHHEEYILDKNDCTNKSAKYARILRENGYDAHMLVISNDDEERGHCITVVFYTADELHKNPKLNRIEFYCTTWNDWGLDVVVGFEEWLLFRYEERFNLSKTAFVEYIEKETGEKQ